MIGVFDSGIGGLIVAKAIKKVLPNVPLIYLGDMARLPYGNKSKQTIIEYTIQCVDFLIKHGARVIVIGCNTASSVALPALRKKFSVPIFGVIDPAVDAAIAATKNKRIGVIATRATVSSGVYKKKLLAKTDALTVIEHATPLLVPLIEEGWGHSKPAMEIMTTYCAPLTKARIDTIILGCTHYPVVMKQIEKTIGKNTILISSADAVAHTIKKFVSDEKMYFRKKPSAFFVTDKTPYAEQLADRWMGAPIHLQLVHL